MEKTIRFGAAMVAVAAALSMVLATPVRASDIDLFLTKGNPSEIYNRVITIDQNTKWVNVSQGEMVKIVNSANGQSFVWNVDTYAFRIDLDTVAPPNFLDGHRVLAYIQTKCDCNGRKS